MTPTTEAIAESVRVLMTVQKKSVNELAQLIGKSQAMASRKYNGRSPFSTDELFAVARWLGTSTDRLLESQLVP